MLQLRTIELVVGTVLSESKLKYSKAYSVVSEFRLSVSNIQEECIIPRLQVNYEGER